MAIRFTRSWLSLVAAFTLTAATSAQQSTAPAREQGLIVGQVVDAATDRPLPGAVVSLMGLIQSDRVTVGGVQKIITGADGYFVFRDLSTGRFRIEAVKPGYLTAVNGERRPNGLARPLTLGANERRGDVVIRMWRPATISGTVVDEVGEPLIGVQMRAFRKAVTAGVRRYLFEESVQTDDRGIYRFSGLVPGEYLVAVSSVQVAAPISIIRELQPGALPRPIGSARGGLFPQPPGSPGAIQVGDSTFAIGPGIPTPIPKSDSLWVYPRTFYPSTLRAQQSLSIVIGSGDDRSGVDLQLAAVPTVRISGTVSPPPPAPLVLALVQPDDVSVVHDEPWLAAFTDANGAFTFPAVPSGQYFVRTRSVDASWADVPLAVDTDHVDGVVVALERGLHISGRLVFEGSQTTPPEAAVKNLAILIQSAEPQLGGTPPPARTDVSGKFTSLAVQGGRYFISIGASPEGWMFKSATYDGRDLSETPIDLRADISGVVITFTDRWTGLSGVVHSAQGAPDPDACVLIFPTDSQKWMGYGRQARRLRSVRPDRSGAFGISSLPPDDYFVVAIPDEQSADWRDPKFLESLARIASVVSIGDGEHRTQNLRTLEVR